MSNTTSNSNIDDHMIMDIVQINQYKTPETLFEDKMNDHIDNFINHIFSDSDSEKIEFQPYDKLNAFHSDQINKIAPWPDWFQLEDMVEEFIEREDTLPKIVFVNKPFSGTDEIIRRFIQDKNYHLLEPPTYRQILSDDLEFELPENGKLSIINLENWFIRDVIGFDFIREVIRQLSNYPDEVIITCQSWTWKFLVTTLHINVDPFDVKIFQAMNNQSLRSWIFNFTIKSGQRKLLYRMADNGKLVSEHQVELMQEMQEAIDDDKSAIVDLKDIDNKFTRHLVGYSLGLPLICWHIWRNSLRLHPDDDFHLEKDDDKELHPYTIWVLPWNMISLPSLPSNITSEHHVILHSLLLHNGLPRKILYDILNFSWHKFRVYLTILEKAGIVRQEDDILFVPANAYPRVRSMLAKSGYIIDNLEDN